MREGLSHAASMETIRSAKNPAIQRLRALRDGKQRGGLLLEGDRLVDDAIAAGVTLESVLVAADRPERLAALAALGLEVRAVEPLLLARCGTLVTAPGCVAVARPPAAPDLDGLLAAEDPLVVVAGGLQDPGNLGALARTAEAAGARLLVVLAGGCSPWSPKALRGSMGSLLRLPVARVADARAAAALLAPRSFRHVLAATRGGRVPEEIDWSGRVALWLTAETGGLDGAEEIAPERVSIPLAGPVESLNVTTAAAVLLFTAARARRATEVGRR